MAESAKYQQRLPAKTGTGEKFAKFRPVVAENWLNQCCDMAEKTIELADEEFAAQMQGLAQAATQALEERAAAGRHGDEGRPAKAIKSPEAEKIREAPGDRETEEKAVKTLHSLPEMLRPLVVGLQVMGRATGENTQILSKMDKLAADPNGAHHQLPQIVADLQALTEQKNSVSRQMFDALHEELRSYKDRFVLDTVHRPMIRDLITLYDDLTEIHRQMSGALTEQAALASNLPEATPCLDRLKGIDKHIEHNLEFLIEVLDRLEVTMLPVGSGKLDKHSQRAVTVEPAEQPEADLDIVRVFKRGFVWRGKVLRPEEVSIKKWKEGYLTALPPDAEKK